MYAPHDNGGGITCSQTRAAPAGNSGCPADTVVLLDQPSLLQSLEMVAFAVPAGCPPSPNLQASSCSVRFGGPITVILQTAVSQLESTALHRTYTGGGLVLFRITVLVRQL